MLHHSVLSVHCHRQDSSSTDVKSVQNANLPTMEDTDNKRCQKARSIMKDSHPTYS